MFNVHSFLSRQKMPPTCLPLLSVVGGGLAFLVLQLGGLYNIFSGAFFPYDSSSRFVNRVNPQFDSYMHILQYSPCDGLLSVFSSSSLCIRGRKCYCFRYRANIVLVCSNVRTNSFNPPRCTSQQNDVSEHIDIGQNLQKMSVSEATVHESRNSPEIKLKAMYKLRFVSFLLSVVGVFAIGSVCFWNAFSFNAYISWCYEWVNIWCFSF